MGTTYSELADDHEENINVFANVSVKTKAGKFGALLALSDIATPWREDAIGIGNPVVNPTVVANDPTVLSSSGYNVSSSYGKFKTEGMNLVLEWQPSEKWEFYAGYNPNKWSNTQDTTQFTTALSAANSVPGSGVLFEGSDTAVRAATFTNVTGTAYGITRDLENQLDMYFLGGRFTSGDLTVHFDGNHLSGFGNAQLLPSFTQRMNELWAIDAAL